MILLCEHFWMFLDVLMPGGSGRTSEPLELRSIQAMINVIGFLFIIAVSVALGYVILTGLYPEVAPAVSLVIYGCTAYVVLRRFQSLHGGIPWNSARREKQKTPDAFARDF